VRGSMPRGSSQTVEQVQLRPPNGVDDYFHRGEGDHERFYATHSQTPMPSWGPSPSRRSTRRSVPGDIGTSGALLCDDFSRVLDTGGDPIAGL